MIVISAKSTEDLEGMGEKGRKALDAVREGLVQQR